MLLPHLILIFEDLGQRAQLGLSRIVPFFQTQQLTISDNQNLGKVQLTRGRLLKCAKVRTWSMLYSSHSIKMLSLGRVGSHSCCKREVLIPISILKPGMEICHLWLGNIWKPPKLKRSREERLIQVHNKMGAISIDFLSKWRKLKIKFQ
jgi:hypothetical protein